MTPGDGSWTSRIAALTAWFILTGGPVPGEVIPPGVVERDMEWFGKSFPDDGKWRWWFRPTYRTETIIRPWLESEWREV
jgi:hypothetical protein